ncbi:MAG TPA: hypothetical protein VMH92_02410, partial [Acidocella sp.]|nr:hypothetical protein [Acidocella sp.]
MQQKPAGGMAAIAPARRPATLPRMTLDPDAGLRASLNRHRLFASALLILMAALALLGYCLPLS